MGVALGVQGFDPTRNMPPRCTALILVTSGSMQVAKLLNSEVFLQWLWFSLKWLHTIDSFSSGEVLDSNENCLVNGVPALIKFS